MDTFQFSITKKKKRKYHSEIDKFLEKNLIKFEICKFNEFDTNNF